MKNTRTPQPLAWPASDIRENGAWGPVLAVLFFLFGNPFAALLEKLEALFEAWRAGTLPPIAAQPAQSPPRPHQTTRVRIFRARTPRAPRPAARLARLRRSNLPVTPLTSAPRPREIHPPRIERPPRTTQKRLGQHRQRTIYLLRYRN